jgi:hypothetical protein
VESTGSCRPSGNLAVCGQQFWLGPARAGHRLTLWIDTITVHLRLEGQHLKTLPSRFASIDLARLRTHGGQIVTIEVDETTLRV